MMRGLIQLASPEDVGDKSFRSQSAEYFEEIDAEELLVDDSDDEHEQPFCFKASPNKVRKIVETSPVSDQGSSTTLGNDDDETSTREEDSDHDDNDSSMEMPETLVRAPSIRVPKASANELQGKYI